jgi:hypothetical protein
MNLIWFESTTHCFKSIILLLSEAIVVNHVVEHDKFSYSCLDIYSFIHILCIVILFAP